MLLQNKFTTNLVYIASIVIAFAVLQVFPIFSVFHLAFFILSTNSRKLVLFNNATVAKETIQSCN